MLTNFQTDFCELQKHMMGIGLSNAAGDVYYLGISINHKVDEENGIVLCT